MSRNEEALIFEIPDFDSIDVGYDDDGMPKTIAKEKAVEPAKEKVFEAKAEPVVDLDDHDTTEADAKKIADELAAARKEAAEAREEARRAREEANAKIEAERQARIKAEGESGASDDRAIRAHWAKVNAEAEQINTAISATKQAMENARAVMKAAKETGDVDKEMKAQEALAELTHDVRELERGKLGAETEKDRVREAYAKMAEDRKKAPEVKEEPKVEPKRSPDDWIAGVRKAVGDGVGDWLSKNKQYVTDPKLNAKVIAFADSFLKIEEKPLNDPEFLKALNDKFGTKEKEPAKAADEGDVDDEDAVEIEKPAPKQAAPKSKVTAAAPVSRSGKYFSSGNMDAKQAKLPPYLANLAREMGYDPIVYARNTVQAIKDGKLPKNYLDPDYPHGQ